ncbi:L,D-transpeptidase family protein [Motilimonas eburnea]|uniref:L,D-transpeptidase family protein n=1 Tax=Motilimonas eburnea TaxID=1737488 RepID=UPI001E2EC478|nr:L,D-transpeptidase family protein [Motilimonas eburnea]MCE2571075.1 L,D-transpeptidase family protein [Motilimonas eburnea]
MKRTLLACSLLILWLSACLAYAALTPSEQPRRQLEQQLQSLSDAPYLMGNKIDYVPWLVALYRQHDYQPIWTQWQDPTQLITALKNAEQAGLNSADYYLATLQQQLSSPSAFAHLGVANQINLDLLMSAAVIKLALHLRLGKLKPQQFEPRWPPTLQPDMTAFSDQLVRHLSQQSLVDFFAQQEPKHPFYPPLKEALAHYQALADQNAFEPIALNVRSLKPNMPSPAIPLIKQRLIELHHLPANPAQLVNVSANVETFFFNEPLIEPIKAFQRQHGLDPDGIIGPATLAALNLSYETRVKRIKMNLERMRWLSSHLQNHEYILVNLASYQLDLFREHRTIWQTHVIVGKKRHATPAFSATLAYLEFNPTWSVPRSIVREMWPKIEQDPNYLSQQNFLVLDQQGQRIALSENDWANYSGRNFPFFLQQQPGPQNALGQVKFIFPNSYSIFLHDTPDKHLFNRTQRNFSHGCVRVEKPLVLAEHLLAPLPQWTPARIHQVVNSQKRTRIQIARPIDVFLFYWTVTAKASDNANSHDLTRVQFHLDAYSKDAKLLHYF